MIIILIITIMMVPIIFTIMMVPMTFTIMMPIMILMITIIILIDEIFSFEKHFISQIEVFLPYSDFHHKLYPY